MGPGRKERLHLTQATRSAQCTMHLTQRWRLEVTMLGTFQEIDVIGVADCLVQMSRIFRCRKHHTQPTEWKRSSLGTTNSKIFTKIKDDIHKACKAGRLNVTWKLSKEHYGCYSSVPWPLNVDQWAPACSCGWHLRSRFKTRQPWTGTFSSFARPLLQHQNNLRSSWKTGSSEPREETKRC